MNCTVRVPVSGVAEYYIQDVSDETEAIEKAMDMAKSDTLTHGRRFELEALNTLTDASYHEVEVDEIEYDDDPDGEGEDDPEVE